MKSKNINRSSKKEVKFRECLSGFFDFKTVNDHLGFYLLPMALTDCGTDILSHFPIPLSLNVKCPVLLLAQVISKALENRFP